MGRQLPQVSVRTEDLPELRAATREAHEAAQELRQAERDLAKAYEIVRQDVYQQIKREVERQMEALGEELAKQRNLATERVMRSMDEFWAHMIGADPEAVHSGDPPELARMLQEGVMDHLHDLEQRVSQLEGRPSSRRAPAGATIVVRGAPGVPDVVGAPEFDLRARPDIERLAQPDEPHGGRP